jgi:hypothetical protein
VEFHIKYVCDNPCGQVLTICPQYVGGADRTLPFDRCPPCVTRALSLIQDRASLVLGKRPQFNELLNAAYMEKQSMGFHTDNERGLGATVSSL